MNLQRIDVCTLDVGVRLELPPPVATRLVYPSSWLTPVEDERVQSSVSVKPLEDGLFETTVDGEVVGARPETALWTTIAVEDAVAQAVAEQDVSHLHIAGACCKVDGKTALFIGDEILCSIMLSQLFARHGAELLAEAIVVFDPAGLVVPRPRHLRTGDEEDRGTHVGCGSPVGSSVDFVFEMVLRAGAGEEGVEDVGFEIGPLSPGNVAAQVVAASWPNEELLPTLVGLAKNSRGYRVLCNAKFIEIQEEIYKLITNVPAQAGARK